MQEPQETQIWSLGQEDPLENDIATHSSILAWEIPWTEKGYNPCNRKEPDMTEVTENAHTHYEMITAVSLDHTHYLCLYYIPMSMNYVTGSLYTLISLTYFAHPPIPLSSDNHQFVLRIYESIFILVYLFCF